MVTDIKRILYAEDDLNDIELTKAALSELNLANELVVVRDGIEAIDYLYCRGAFAGRANDEPALVLLDLKMPRMSGIEVLQQMKSDERLKLIPIVMLTSSREEQDLISSYQLGVNAYVVKPVHFEDFVMAVKQLGVFWAVINEPPPLNKK